MNSKLSILLTCCLVASCGLLKPRVVHDVYTQVVYRDRFLRDSLYFRDSIYIKEKTKGDTVYVDRFSYKYVYRDKLRTDTLLREVHDTTFRDIPVPAKISVTQRFRIRAFWWLILLAIIGFRREILALIKKII